MSIPMCVLGKYGDGLQRRFHDHPLGGYSFIRIVGHFVMLFT